MQDTSQSYCDGSFYIGPHSNSYTSLGQRHQYQGMTNSLLNLKIGHSPCIKMDPSFTMLQITYLHWTYYIENRSKCYALQFFSLIKGWERAGTLCEKYIIYRHCFTVHSLHVFLFSATGKLALYFLVVKVYGVLSSQHRMPMSYSIWCL